MGMGKNTKRSFFFLLLAFGFLPLSCAKNNAPKDLRGQALVDAAKKEGGTLLTYGLASQWPGYNDLFHAFEKKYGIKHIDVDMGSGAVIETLEREKGKPQCDVAEVGVTYAILGKQKGLLENYISPNTRHLPAWAQDKDGAWCGSYRMTLGFMVNEDVVKKIPKRWSDLLNPSYKGMIAYMNPLESFTGFVTIITSAYANGGSLENYQPGIQYLKHLHAMGNVKLVVKQPPLSEFSRGELPILISYDSVLLFTKHQTHVKASVIIPEDGSVVSFYAHVIPKGAPHPYTARLFSDFYTSLKGQKILAKNYLMPIRDDVELPPDVQSEFPPRNAYKHAKIIDWSKAIDIIEKARHDWQNEIHAN